MACVWHILLRACESVWSMLDVLTTIYTNILLPYLFIRERSRSRAARPGGDGSRVSASFADRNSRRGRGTRRPPQGTRARGGRTYETYPLCDDAAKIQPTLEQHNHRLLISSQVREPPIDIRVSYLREEATNTHTHTQREREREREGAGCQHNDGDGERCEKRELHLPR